MTLGLGNTNLSLEDNFSRHNAIPLAFEPGSRGPIPSRRTFSAVSSPLSMAGPLKRPSFTMWPARSAWPMPAFT